MMPERLTSRGFTLVEVMVALAVVAVALPALMFSLQQQIDGTAYLRDKSIAHIIAANKLAELRLRSKATGQLLKGKDAGIAQMAEREWAWQILSTETQMPRFYRLEIKVFEPGSDQNYAIYTLVAFLSAELSTDGVGSAQGG